MKQLTKISDQPKQTFITTLENGETVHFNMIYSELLQYWFLVVKYKDFIDNFKIVVSFNLLDQYRNILPFGVYSASNTGFQPFFIDDFVNGNNELYLIEGDELKEIRKNILQGSNGTV